MGSTGTADWPPTRLVFGLETKEAPVQTVDSLEEGAEVFDDLDDAGVDTAVESAVANPELVELGDFLSEDAPPLTDLEAKYDTGPVGTPGGRQNWVDRTGGLDPFLRAVAHALIRSGHSKSNAIQIAWGVIRNWAEGKGNVSAKTRAKAVRTVAAMDAKRVAAHAMSGVQGKGWSDAVEAIHDTSALDGSLISISALTPLEGSLEELRAGVMDEIKARTGLDHIVLGTWPDRMVLLGEDQTVSTVTIGWDETKSQLAVGDPVEVKDDAGLLELAEDVLDAVDAFETDTDPVMMQVKLFGGDLPGSYEALRCEVRDAVRDLLNPDPGMPGPDDEDGAAGSQMYSNVIATYPDYALVSVEGDESGERMLKIGYTTNDADGSVELGDVQVVKVTPNVTEISDLGSADTADVADLTDDTGGGGGAPPAENAPAGISTKADTLDVTDETVTADAETTDHGLTTEQRRFFLEQAVKAAATADTHTDTVT